ncbi:MAG TPA: hypothetical protein VFD37_01685, partial [Solirubrobacterales bacterium]|nr:hypothetical protein [Solirubrobacterales bacterium]
MAGGDPGPLRRALGRLGLGAGAGGRGRGTADPSAHVGGPGGPIAIGDAAYDDWAVVRDFEDE